MQPLGIQLPAPRHPDCRSREASTLAQGQDGVTALGRTSHEPAGP